MKIRFDHPASLAHLTFQPGDEIVTDHPSPALLQLLSAVRVDGQHVARVVRESDAHEVATVERDDEVAVTVGRKRRGVRTAAVS